MTTVRGLWPKPGEHAITHWGYLAAGLGARWPFARGLLLGFRGVRVEDEETHTTVSRPELDDSFVLIGGDGMFPPYIFPGATHAFQRDSKASPDVNHDGRGDVGTIKPGRYRLRYAGGKYPEFRVLTPDGSGEIPCYRDLDHDGVAESDGHTATDILFHTDWTAPPDARHKSSIGCQTTRLVHLDYLKREALAHGGEIDYWLFDLHKDPSEVLKSIGSIPASENIA